MSLKDRITEDMKAAMRAKEAQKLTAIRMLLAAIKQKEVDERVVPSDADVLVLLSGQELGSWAEKVISPFFWSLVLPAVDPVAQALRLEIQRKVGEGAVRAGELPPLAPAVLPPNAPERAGDVKPTAAEISRLSSTARFSNTIADYLKSDLVKFAVDSGLVKLDAVKAELDKQVAAGAIEAAVGPLRRLVGLEDDA